MTSWRVGPNPTGQTSTASFSAGWGREQTVLIRTETTTKQHKWKEQEMNNKFDELTKGLAQSVTRRGALKNFGVGLAGIVLITLGFARRAEAGTRLQRCINQCKNDCAKL